MEHESRHPIQIVATRTGLTPHVIRIWERRYGAVSPERTPTNRRLYSDDDIDRLRLLCRATQLGRSIGQVAGLSTSVLQEMVSDDERNEAAANSAIDVGAAPETKPGDRVAACIRAIEAMDDRVLEAALAQAELALPQAQCVECVIAPLIQEIGDRWRAGTLRIGHEHLASGVIRTFLSAMRQGLRASANAPCLIAATLSGQHHELGIQMVSTLAAIDGWRVTYLGPNLPSEEIAAAVEMVGARVVALSFVYPPDDAQLPRELKRLRRSIGSTVSILAGGRAVEAYADVFAEIGAIRLNTLGEFRNELERHRA